jgi:hypothetical protein
LFDCAPSSLFANTLIQSQPEVRAKIDAICDEAEKKTIEQIAADASKAMTIGTLRFAGPCVVFECIKAAAADGLDDDEMVAIKIIAGKMDVSEDQVQKMKELLAEEEALKKKRISLCIPAHPCLADKYKE